MRITIAFLVLVLITSCKRSEISTQKHEFSKIQKADGNLICKQKPIAAEHKVIYDYTRAILQDLLSKNREFIRGDHASIDNYCIAINPSEIVNAGASFTGDILIYAGIFSVVKEDANFAAIMAHELAHVLNDHNLFHARSSDLNAQKIGDKLASEYEILVENAKKYDLKFQSEFTNGMEVADKFILQVREAKLKREDYYADVPFYMGFIKSTSEKIILANMGNNPSKIANGDDLFNEILAGKIDPVASDEMSTLSSTRDEMIWSIEPISKEAFLEAERSLYKEIYGMTIIELKRSQAIDAKYEFELKHLGPDAASNWTEQEADEMGFEIFVRSGFEVQAMIETFDLGLSKKDATSISEQSIQNEKEAICERGAATHPAMCWRVKNFSKEYAAHKAEYDRLNGHIRNLLTDSELNLAMVKKEIEENRLSMRPGQIDLTSESKITKNCKNYSGGFGTSFEYRGQMCRKINTDWKKNGSPRYYCFL